MIRLGFRHYKNLIMHKAWADFRAEAERTYLGVVWWVLDPLINMAIFYLVFGVFLKMGTEDFIPFLLTGLVVWRFIEATVVRASNSILQNVTMVRQVAFRKVIFPLIAVGTCVMEYMFSLALLFTVLLIYGYRPGVTWLAVPVLLAVELAFVLAMSLPLAVVVTFVPDVGKLITQVLRILFYLSGIFYTAKRLPPSVGPWLKFNPAIHIVEGMRDVLMYGVWPNWVALGVVGLVSVLAAVGGWVLIGRFDPLFAKRIAR
jgi:lipopolysaccharide transport system permease protein